MLEIVLTLAAESMSQVGPFARKEGSTVTAASYLPFYFVAAARKGRVRGGADRSLGQLYRAGIIRTGNRNHAQCLQLW
jgi:hypothetical protein